MTKDENIVRYTRREIADMLARGEDRTDRARIMAKSEAQIAADTAEDPAWDGIDVTWVARADTKEGPGRPGTSDRDESR